MPEKPVILETQKLSKTYRLGNEDVRALRDVDLKIRENDYAVILGASGSGKSTLMHILGFMDTPTSGKIIFDGADVSRISSNKRAWYRSNRIGFVFQTFNLLPRLSVLKNVMLPFSYSREKIENPEGRAREALEKVGMLHRQNHVPNQLSGGERQRVSIARALVNRPRVIFADEPTGALDVKNVKKVLELFDELVRGGQTIVMVTHDLGVANCAHRIIRMSDGAIIEDALTQKGMAAQ
ncbi:MAG: ABC transporter ATP-binding protein [Opitutales bacterium]|nr:ABC transporter ATP-binding protein [Opitutales bacterium]